MVDLGGRLPTHAQPPEHAAILRAGHNCWRVERASRFACIQDAADYFRLARQAMLQARDTIFSVGWDISATLDLVPTGASDGAPTRLDELLPWLVRRQPTLRCYILTWDYAALYTFERDPWTRWRLGWRMPSGVQFGFDDHHPFGASHHQKIIVVDDVLAFSGGVDLTGHRWDTASHRLDEPHRLNADGTPYGPYHEIQAMADGPVAAALGALVRDRWDALGQRTRPLASHGAQDLWPAEITPDLTDVDVAIARTMAPSERNGAIRECERSFLDSIAAAKDAIYIENQYFTNDTLAHALARRLGESDGPEVVVVMPKECEGWIEKQTMGVLRHEALEVLVEADRHRRLRLVYPVASRARDVATFVHSKVMIVDDRLLRIGSANMSHRSMGVDSECDLIADAGADPVRRAGVRHTRDRLLGEQLGLPPDIVTAEMTRLGSMRALIDARASADRTLLPIDMTPPPEAPPEAVKAAADPDEPLDVSGVTEVLPPLDARAAGNTIRRRVAAFAITVTLLAAARLLSGSGAIDGAFARSLSPSLFGIAVAVVVVAHLAFVPLELLAILAGAAFGSVVGGGTALAGAWLGAATGYVVGRRLGPGRIMSWMSRRAYRSARQLGGHGVVGVAVLRLMSIASALSVNLVCGAMRVPVGSYLLGSAAGLALPMFVLAGVGSVLGAAFREPSWPHGLTAAAAVLGACALAFAVRALLVARQFSPTWRRHRAQAEFG
jgi:phospholipase D1/2